MKTRIVIVGALIALCSAGASAQQSDNPMHGILFEPELVMQNQQSLGLTEDQKTYFRTETRQAQMRFTELQWSLESEVEKMVSFAKQPKADETQILAQLDKVLGLEREIKRAQFSLLLRIKNKLTAEQQARLREIQSKLVVK